ncbi:RNA methyltransferase [Candidatus Puniceispirillum marinum]|uniref:RNA methyltransferase TrmH, group 1 n=1 Tax=Puniceispirillum marinum (strain IMCC1322) TaxID=488538 RepID=D5BRM2_PUNMI|nr:RNA methyltransferase [Candidatus Puniceispirillum marinum]ADE38919.1 RNA methyltransferase TrmH, group 1 [Candidatus Puniceispirillum marinum IMCC1322]
MMNDLIPMDECPVVILARPQMAENIGATARAMMNCGLRDLRIVKPRDGWPNPVALPMAAGGKSIIETAQVFDTLADATHDICFMAAATARQRDMPIRASEPRAIGSELVQKAKKGRVALLFGPEASGLDNNEVVLADVAVSAALNPAYPSLNLAQAVLLLAWEWRVAALSDIGDDDRSEPSDDSADDDDAPIKERDYFFQRLENALDDSGFFSSTEMAPAVKRNIRALINRATPSRQEIGTLHGIIQALTSKRRDR